MFNPGLRSRLCKGRVKIVDITIDNADLGEVADFKRVVVYPRAVIIGLVCQMLLLPVVCYGLAIGFFVLRAVHPGQG